MTGPDPMDRITFETDHLCEVEPDVLDTHAVTGWQSATPGLAVFHNAGANVPCHPVGDPCDPTFGEWTIWNTTHGTRVWGADEPEEAMRRAELLGRYRDWDGPRAAGPPLGQMLDDLAERGEL
jgi:hypothetical protein